MNDLVLTATEKTASTSPFLKRLLSELAHSHREKVVVAMDQFDFLTAWEEELAAPKVKVTFFRGIDRWFPWDKVVDLKASEITLESVLKNVQAAFEERSISFKVGANDLEVGWELWGYAGSSYDRSIEADVMRLVGAKEFHSKHGTKKDEWGRTRIVYSCRASFDLPTQNYIEDYFTRELDARIEKWRRQAELNGYLG